MLIIIIAICLVGFILFLVRRGRNKAIESFSVGPFISGNLDNEDDNQLDSMKENVKGGIDYLNDLFDTDNSSSGDDEGEGGGDDM
jgi:hypothetical protein